MLEVDVEAIFLFLTNQLSNSTHEKEILWLGGWEKDLKSMQAFVEALTKLEL